MFDNKTNALKRFEASRSPVKVKSRSPSTEDKPNVIKILSHCKFKYNIDSSTYKALLDSVTALLKEREINRDLKAMLTDKLRTLERENEDLRAGGHPQSHREVYDMLNLKPELDRFGSRRLSPIFETKYNTCQKARANYASIHEVQRLEGFQGQMEEAHSRLANKGFELREAQDRLHQLQKELLLRENEIKLCRQELLDKARALEAREKTIGKLKEDLLRAKGTRQRSDEDRGRQGKGGLLDSEVKAFHNTMHQVSSKYLPTLPLQSSMKVINPSTGKLSGMPVKPLQFSLVSARKPARNFSPYQLRASFSNELKARLQQKGARPQPQPAARSMEKPQGQSAELGGKKAQSNSTGRKPANCKSQDRSRLVPKLSLQSKTTRRTAQQKSQPPASLESERQQLTRQFREERAALLQACEAEKAAMRRTFEEERARLINGFESDKSQLLKEWLDKQTDQIAALKAGFIKDFTTLRQKQRLLDEENKFLKASLMKRSGCEMSCQTEETGALTGCSEVESRRLIGVINEKDEMINKFRDLYLGSEKELKIKEKQLRHIKKKISSHLDTRSQLIDELDSQVGVFENFISNFGQQRKG